MFFFWKSQDLLDFSLMSSDLSEIVVPHGVPLDARSKAGSPRRHELASSSLMAAVESWCLETISEFQVMFCSA